MNRKKILIAVLSALVISLLFGVTAPATAAESTTAYWSGIVYSDNDYGCGWENYASTITIENSYEIGVNIAVHASKGSGDVTIMQVVHSGDCNPDPGSLQNLVNQINSRTSVAASNGGWAFLGFTNLSNVDLLYITGHYPFSLSDVEKAALKSYLDGGGILFADDCSNYLDNQGFETSFRNLVLAMYGSPLSVLLSDNPVYSSFYALDGTDFSYTAAGNGTQWNQEPLEGLTVVITVLIDIKPGSYPNSINLGNNGVVPVAILSSDVFDASTVDPLTVVLAEASVRLKGKSGNAGSLEDVNGDGLLDLVVQVQTSGLDLLVGEAEAELTGQTYDGTPIHGTDSVRIVPPE